MKWITISIQALVMLAMPAFDVSAMLVALVCVKRWVGVLRSSN